MFAKCLYLLIISNINRIDYMAQTKKVSAKGFIKTLFYASAIIIVLVVIFNLFSYSAYQEDEQKKYKEETANKYEVYPFPVPDSLNFFGERVPLENFDVRESLDMEIQKIAYWHAEMILYMKRANRYFPVIEPILKQNNIPDDFKYVCITESGLTNAVSPAKAEGFWQFVEGTAKQYKLEVNDEVDERYHLTKATQAACKFLKAKYSKFGSWTLTAASYNAGDSGIARFVNFQGEKSYYDLALYTETGRYVYRALAIKLIMQNPKDYGFSYTKNDLYPIIPTKPVEVDSAITNLAQFAKSQGTNYKMLKLFNPWLRDKKLSNKNKTKYIIDIPVEGARAKDYFD
jgi:membrane-bound lytic murein transglycosylase D